MSQPAWRSLPVEIWLTLCIRLRPQDLAALCLTSSQFLSISRPILYRSLVLAAEKQGQPNDAVKRTFSLLAAEPELAKNVHELTLDAASSSHEYFRNPGLVDVASLKNLTELRRLTIVGDIGRHAGTQTKAEFVQILHDLELHELRFPSPGARVFLLALDPVRRKLTANVKLLKLYVPRDHNDLFLRCSEDLLTSAIPSLTSLSFRATRKHMLMLFQLRFPQLRSLELTNIERNGLTSPPGFNDFLSAHHEMLEELRLADDQPDSGTNATVFDGNTALHSNFLPNLRVLTAHRQIVEMMATARLRCLSKLQKLSITFYLLNPTQRLADIRRMLDALAAFGRLDALIVLHFNIFYWETVECDFIPYFIHQIGALCGSTLQVWRGLLPYAGSWPLDAFAAFPQLRIIHFPQHIDSPLSSNPPPNSGPLDALENVRGIASICTALEEITIVAPKGGKDASWMVDRRSASETGIALIRLE